MTHSRVGTHCNSALNHLLTALACGSLGIAAIVAFRTGAFTRINPSAGFQSAVGIGGLALILVVVLRVVCIWRNARKASPDDRVDQGRASFWQYPVLIVPVLLLCLGLPANGNKKSGSGAHHGKSNRLVPEMLLSALQRVASTDKGRKVFSGRIIAVRGQLSLTPGLDNTYTMFRLCPEDDAERHDREMPRVLILAPAPLDEFRFEDWIEVEGELTFRKDENRDVWLPVIRMVSINSIKKIDRPKNLCD